MATLVHLAAVLWFAFPYDALLGADRMRNSLNDWPLDWPVAFEGTVMKRKPHRKGKRSHAKRAGRVLENAVRL